MGKSTQAKPKRRPKGVIDFVRHLHPGAIYPRSLEARTTLGLGLISLYLCGILLVTGVLLMLYYIPHAEHAYGSIQDLHSVIPFGGLVRNAHRWAGHALVATVGLHLLRCLLTGAYKGRSRRGVWTAGIWLLVITLAFAFTGYLLPWDQLAYWAVSIGGHLAANIPLLGSSAQRALLGGSEVGNATLVRFYALHVGILPMMCTAMIIVHLYRFRRAGGLARTTDDEKTERLPAWPHLFELELALLLGVTAAVLLAGALIEAPLGPEPDFAHPDDPSKAPWYFLFLQELVSYSAVVGGVVLPLIAVILLYCVPFIDTTREGSGRWLQPRPTATLFWGGFCVGLGLVMGALGAHESSRVAAVINPATALLLGAALVGAATYFIGRARKPDLAPQLTLMVLTGYGTAALFLLTFIGIFRGPSWSLLLPWGNG